ncbi:MAG TPA: hypothetical protein VLZ03_15525 [Thermodesulfobacteriota bacterium]|nr:hypothetical protein [Thermodesulfobacteriota bacterium]
MVKGSIEVEDVKAVFKQIGVESEECNLCMRWSSPALEKPLTSEDIVIAELTPEEEGFLRCMDYVYEDKVIDSLRATALYETFWNTVRSLHDLPRVDLAVKEGKYVVTR